MKIKELRQRKKISQTKLGQLLGVHLRTIQGWESGKTPIPDKRLPKLAEIFNIEMSEILKMKYDLSKEKLQAVAEEQGIYKKQINEYSNLSNTELQSLLKTEKIILTKITNSIKELEANGKNIEVIETLIRFQDLKKKTLENIKKINLNL